ncbi:MAG: DUF4157 domain-containing protein, partial [Chloroflexota bacterium]|nr:DUF4157 domain-containing protein [Chloroflexota bacterium]
MHQRELATTDPSRKARVSPSTTRETQETDRAHLLWHDPLVEKGHRPVPIQRAAAHPETLRAALAAGPTLARQSLLELQRQHGNRHVQRVLAVARQAKDEREAGAGVEEAIQRARGGGQPLDGETRARMERAFAVDFSGVRVHTDAEANALNLAVSARAFTTGQDIFFREGEYNPGSSGGRRLLAHELTHVVQQSGGRVQPKLVVNQAGDAYEQEADSVAEAVMRMHD